MNSESQPRNGLLAIRVSSTKQGLDGDSPEAQREQGERYAENHNIAIIKTLSYLESASKEAQPMQHVVDFAKNPKNGINVVIVKSIDRFTRGGSYAYDHMKMQLEPLGIELLDMHGIISNVKVNTLDHLGVEYDWSKYSPSRKAELLEAERAKDELRDIMTRMIGSQVRYTRLGFWMRRPPYGFVNQRVDTAHPKRYILVPQDDEAFYIRKMFELRCRGELNDKEIVKEINRLGYKSRKYYKRDKKDPTKMSVSLGGKPLTLKRFWMYIANPIYAGVMVEKWTNYEPVKCQFDGLVSYEEFNQANRGKIIVREIDGEVKLAKQEAPVWQTREPRSHADYPYRKIVGCSECAQPLYGSAAKGRYKYYPAYHCNKRGHYFRVRKEEFNKTITDFTKQLVFAPEHIDNLVKAVEEVMQKRQISVEEETLNIDKRISELEAQAKAVVDKIKVLNSESAIKYLEEDLMKIEAQMSKLKDLKELKQIEQPKDMNKVVAYVKYFLEHLEYLLLEQIDPIKKANFFGLIFNKTPTYAEIVSGTTGIQNITGVNELFTLKDPNYSRLVRVKRL